MGRRISSVHTIPFKGGIDEVHELPDLDVVEMISQSVAVGISQARNVRPLRDEFEQRGGMAKHHTTTAHSTKEITSLFGFSKGRITERDMFAQLDNGSVEKATDDPPGTTTGNFGTSVLAARSNSFPGAFANFKDYMLYADGAGQAQIYTGATQNPILFNVYKGSKAIPDVPEEGADYTQEVIDGRSTTVAVLDSLDTLANFDALFVGFEVPMNKITFTVPAVNGNASTATVSYRKNDNTWADTSATDGTETGGDTSLGQTGSFTWTLPTDEISHYAFGGSLFWYRITFSAALDAEVEVSAISGENSAGFQDLRNVWDGVLREGLQAIVQDTSASTYAKYSSQIVKPGELVGAASHDFIYISSLDPAFGLYIDVGRTPNTTATTTIDQIALWDGIDWNITYGSGSGLSDGTAGGSNSGHVTWPRNTTQRKFNFQSSLGQPTYWIRVRFDKTLSANLTWAIFTMPYLDINETHNPTAQTTAAWDERAWYSFNDNTVYGTAKFNPTGLNGDDYVILPMGDNKANKVICMRRFYNFLLAWQEEKGEGGAFHMIQPGTTSTGYKSQVISTDHGILNSKCAVVLEGVNMSDLSTVNPTMTGVFFMSQYGIFKSDGRFPIDVSGGIANYFDPERPEHIRNDYENEHFMAWDSASKCIIIGIVSGNSATKPNKWFLFDPATGNYTEDVWGKAISCMAEIEAASGDIPILQYAGCQDGFVRRINTGNQDDSVDITSNIVFELDGRGKKFRLHEEALVCRSQASGNIVRTIAVNGNSSFGKSKTYSMIAKTAGDGYRRHRGPSRRILADHLSIKYENSTSDVPARYITVGWALEDVDNRV